MHLAAIRTVKQKQIMVMAIPVFLLLMVEMWLIEV